MRQKHAYSRGWLAALAAVVAFGCLLAVPQGAKASLIGDTFTLFIPLPPALGGDIEFNDVLVVDDPMNPEFFSGDGTAFSDLVTIPPPPGNPNNDYFIDVQESSIVFFFNFTHQFSFFFTDLDWFGMEGEITGVTASVSPSGAGMITEFSTAHGVDASFDCFFGTTCDGSGQTGTTFTIFITAEHDEPEVPEPSTVTLFGVGLSMLGLMVMWRRRRQAA